ncbi:low molecular weight protein-tyrosine-phosphatase [Nannocystis pusilla]|uniref:low molecular weight protein-tyrosine-phosphatase n=1 Tax=Nannocystis pusilla TaxID=889268 RepID=UPI003DA5D7E6
MSARPVGVLFVCYANIVRSPLAAAVFTRLADERGVAARFRIDSAGVAADAGNPAHAGSVRVAADHGLTLTHSSRLLRRDDLFDFDEVLLLDRLVASELRRLTAGSAFGPIAGPGRQARIRLLASLADPSARGADLDVPDPVRGGPEGFLSAYRQIARACAALLDDLSVKT